MKQAVAWALGLTLLAYLLTKTPTDQLMDAIQRPTALTWMLTIAALLLSYGLRGARLQVVLGLDDRNPAPHRWLGLRTDALRVILLHNAAVNLLPMRAGELSFPWLAARELKLPLSRSVVCLMWMRLQDLVVLAALGLTMWPSLSVRMRLMGLLALLLCWHGGWRLLARVLTSQRWTAPSANGKAPTAWRDLVNKLKEALLEPAHHRPLAWVLTLANWSVKLAAGACLLSAISQSPWSAAWGGALGGELAAIFPLQGPAGFGTYEAGVWAGMATLLPATAPSLSHAVSAALALHVCFLICALMAAAIASLLKRPTSSTPGQEDLPPGHPD